MGKKKDGKKSGGKDKAAHCGRCKNFDPDKKGGYCRKHDKKRSADDKVCGSFDPR
jgi:hypothetical protein